MLKQLDLFKVHGYLPMSQTNRKTGEKIYFRKYGSFAGIILTLLIVFAAFSYLSYLIEQTNHQKFDKLEGVLIPNPFQSDTDQFIFMRDKYVFQPILTIRQFDNETLPAFDVYKEGENTTTNGHLNIDHAKLRQYFNPVFVVDDIQDGTHT